PAYQSHWDPANALQNAAACTEVTGAAAARDGQSPLPAPHVTARLGRTTLVVRVQVPAASRVPGGVAVKMIGIAANGHGATWTYSLRSHQAVLRVPIDRRLAKPKRLLVSTIAR